eukprot:CAMPEP_0119312872 /NCGR_PEP_ID=MMETSP1333-20130426/27061_1 /TAXON_ID=418940 /ORGANISM="Scyphosphaera apsteinii, Strain RCC1455" /LENGTH=448 /DNA_ID=CAMNT_0007317553 /DNA_START=72 /DNA_END=1415 /DNA_ORIENTATION=+
MEANTNQSAALLDALEGLKQVQASVLQAASNKTTEELMQDAASLKMELNRQKVLQEIVSLKMEMNWRGAKWAEIKADVLQNAAEARRQGTLQKRPGLFKRWYTKRSKQLRKPQKELRKPQKGNHRRFSALLQQQLLLREALRNESAVVDGLLGWREQFRSVIRGLPSDFVTDTYSVCSGADVVGILAAFPYAFTHTLVSREAITVRNEIFPVATDALRDDVTRVFVGYSSYMTTLDLQSFSTNWGILPLLLAGLQITGHNVTKIHPWRLGGLHGVELKCTRNSNSNLSVLRYVQADISSEHDLQQLQMLNTTVLVRGSGNRSKVVKGRSAMPRYIVGTLVKAADFAFDGATMVSRHLLENVDVVLQDSETGLPWNQLRSWATHAVPFGTVRNISVANGSHTIAFDFAKHEEVWRSLKGVRFGPCQSLPSLDGVTQGNLAKGKAGTYDW